MDLSLTNIFFFYQHITYRKAVDICCVALTDLSRRMPHRGKLQYGSWKRITHVLELHPSMPWIWLDKSRFSSCKFALECKSKAMLNSCDETQLSATIVYMCLFCCISLLWTNFSTDKKCFINLWQVLNAVPQCVLFFGKITDLLITDWQLPDINKTITNYILLSILSAYGVRIVRYIILSIGGSRLFPCISVSCRVIPIDTHWFVYSRKK